MIGDARMLTVSGYSLAGLTACVLRASWVPRAKNGCFTNRRYERHVPKNGSPHSFPLGPRALSLLLLAAALELRLAAMLYTGAMEKGQMHGKGALVYPNGEKYEGDFQHGKRHGFGVYSYSDGGRFEGEWVDDKVHGRGVSVYASGNR